VGFLFLLAPAIATLMLVKRRQLPRAIARVRGRSAIGVETGGGAGEGGA
jgi:hypothetical protein